MMKLVFKMPKLVSPAFYLQGLGWISLKKTCRVDDKPKVAKSRGCCTGNSIRIKQNISYLS